MAVEVVPAILVGTFEELAANLGKVSGVARWVQLDVCDGFFVSSRTWPMNPGDGPQFARIVNGVEDLPYREDFSFDVDLMVHDPEKLIPDWVRAGAARVTIHLEAKHDFPACRRAAKDVELGIALVSDTPLSRLVPLKGQFDYLQLMGIAKVGYQGQPFDERVLIRIRETKKEFPGVTIQIDGGVNGETAHGLVEAGADRLVSGSYILHASDPRIAIRELQNA